MELAGGIAIPYELALFGYATSIMIVGLHLFSGWPRASCREDEERSRKTIACMILAFGSIDQLAVSIVLFIFYLHTTLQATTFGVFGILWLAVFLVEFLSLDTRVLSPIMSVFAVYTAFAGYWFLLTGRIVTPILLWSASLLNVSLAVFYYNGKGRKIPGILGIENAIIAYYLVFAGITTAVFNVSLPL